ncbi:MULTISPECIES: beta-ketoacyl synthase N-terminal-like domain-containing protein [unclassified Mesorhizobium]|uniref:beta-ketoacyl synthase N-terminal-like domain-containing protein n=1 Tax=unclassified Mesorhizobium TaxID=325217 RepID=UPI0016752CD7|nr:MULTISPECIES: beta-ketoacyl synthase N-terminal-like domain-containing protein [unclassified Mesorhizobium]
MLIEMRRRLRAAGASALPLYGASNHGETDALVDLAQRIAEARPAPPSLWRSLLVDPVPEAVLDDGSGIWLSSACTSGSHALILACAASIDTGGPSAVIAVDALSAIGVVGFARVGATTSEPARPFLEDRAGLVVGEGAAALWLAVHPTHWPAIVGIGVSCDASHPTDPDPQGTFLASAIEEALAQAGLSAAGVSGIIAHGTATMKNDVAEAAAFLKLWPGGPPPVTSVKRGVGHTMGVAGLLNVIVAIQALKDGVMPPAVADGATIAQIDLVRGAPRPIPGGGALLALASGFGGNNTAIVVSNRQA